MVDLPKHPVVRGHPLHAMLSDVPIGLLPAALASAIAARGEQQGSPMRRGANTIAAMTFAAAASAAAVGVWDWVTIPRSHPAWWPATLHGAINIANVVALGAAAARPRRRIALYAAVTGGVLVSGWLGGELVFSHGWRVTPAEEYEQLLERLDTKQDDAAAAEARGVVAEFEREKTFLPA